MQAGLSRMWWAFLLRGILAIAFGITAFAWPALTLDALIYLFGTYAFVNGVVLLFKATRSWKVRSDRWILLMEGLLGVGVGIVSFAAPRVTALSLVFYIAAWSLATGFMELVLAVRLREEVRGEVWMILSGIVSILFAFALMLFPGAGALGLLWLISAYAMVFGLLLVLLSVRLLLGRNAGTRRSRARTA